MKLNIQKIPLERLIPAEYNPRKDLRPEDPEYQKLKKSLEEFGYVDPIIWNEQTGNVVGGHQRLKILAEMGAKDADVSVVNLSPEKEKALNIALNKIEGEWDDERLAEVLLEIEDAMREFTGFETDEIQELMADMDMGIAEDDDFDIESAIGDEEPKTQEGDLWLLGKHRLLCGSSTELENVERLMDGETCDLILTDPPYNVAYHADEDGEMTIQNDDMDESEFEEFLKDAFVNMWTVAKAGAPIYVFHSDTGGFTFRKTFTEAGFKMAQCLIWVKNHFVMGRQDYQWRHEPILYGWKLGGAHTWYGKRAKDTIITGKSLTDMTSFELVATLEKMIEETPNSIIHCNRPMSSKIHPTMKPLEILGTLINNSSKSGDIVLDLFSGSGSTMMAAEQMGRICYAMELDPKYADASVKRYMQAFGGGQVRLVRGGQEISAEGAGM